MADIPQVGGDWTQEKLARVTEEVFELGPLSRSTPCGYRLITPNLAVTERRITFEH